MGRNLTCGRDRRGTRRLQHCPRNFLHRPRFRHRRYFRAERCNWGPVRCEARCNSVRCTAARIAAARYSAAAVARCTVARIAAARYTAAAEARYTAAPTAAERCNSERCVRTAAPVRCPLVRCTAGCSSRDPRNVSRRSSSEPVARAGCFPSSGFDCRPTRCLGSWAPALAAPLRLARPALRNAASGSRRSAPGSGSAWRSGARPIRDFPVRTSVPAAVRRPAAG